MMILWKLYETNALQHNLSTVQTIETRTAGSKALSISQFPQDKELSSTFIKSFGTFLTRFWHKK